MVNSDSLDKSDKKKGIEQVVDYMSISLPWIENNLKTGQFVSNIAEPDVLRSQKDVQYHGFFQQNIT